MHVVLKGHRTVIAAPDGRTFVNLTGNAGMATGGTGDLLTGMIAAWFAQLLDAEAACKLAVYLHGTAGDLAEADEGEVALVAGDLATRLGDAVLELTARRQVKRDVVSRDVVMTAGGRGDGRRRRAASRATLSPGAVVLLYGQLGAGKTAFVRGLARGLGAAADEVSSPTFTIIQEYVGRDRDALPRRPLSPRAGRSRRPRPRRAGQRRRHRRDRMGRALARAARSMRSR